MTEIHTELDAEAAVAGSGAAPILIYKHSPICDLSGLAEAELLEFLEAGGWPGRCFRVDVIAARAASMRLARLLDIRHESPQVLIVRDSRCGWHASHRRINQGWLDSCAKQVAPT